MLGLLLSYVFVNAIGALWYSPLLFGNIWAKKVNIKHKNPDVKKTAALVRTFLGNAATVLIIYAIVKVILPAAAMGTGALWIGLLLGALLCSSQVGHASFTGQPLVVYLINSSHDMTAILGAVLLVNYFE